MVESMAMELAVIATDFSGPTAYMSPDRAYPVRSEGVNDAGQALPSMGQLRRAMRSVHSHPDEARRRGRAARSHVVQHYDTAVVARLVASRLGRMATEAEARRAGSSGEL